MIKKGTVYDMEDGPFSEVPQPVSSTRSRFRRLTPQRLTKQGKETVPCLDSGNKKGVRFTNNRNERRIRIRISPKTATGLPSTSEIKGGS